MDTDRIAILTRLLLRVEITQKCWLWKEHVSKNEYPMVWFDGQVMGAYRAMYILLIGPVPPGKHLHHLPDICGNKTCIRPDHLAPLTPSDHCKTTAPHHQRKLKNSEKTHCLKGHPYSDDNTWIGGKGQRFCKACSRERGFERRRQLGETPGRGRGADGREKTHCIRGHEFAGDNLIVRQGKRYCRSCTQILNRRARERKKKEE